MLKSTLLVIGLLALSAELSGQLELSVAAVTSAADGSPQLAPGGIVSIWGTGLAAATAVAPSAFPLPTRLGGASVEVIDRGSVKEAPLFFVSPNQINAQLPFGLGPNVQLRVKVGQATSAPVGVPVEVSSPRLFTIPMTGKGIAIALRHPDYALITEANPARPGDAVMLWLTGLGEVNPPCPEGTPALRSLSRALVTATLAGEAAPVLWAGLAPGMAGLNQVNMLVPPRAKTGLLELVLEADGRRSQAEVVLPVGP